jgi:hypothetical protein
VQWTTTSTLATWRLRPLRRRAAIEDPFVLLFVGNDRGECTPVTHSATSNAAAEARSALGLGSVQRRGSRCRRLNGRSTMMRRRMRFEPRDVRSGPFRTQEIHVEVDGPPVTAVNRIDVAPSMSADAVISRERTQTC